MTSKDQFVADSKLREWWSNVSQDSRFDKVLLHAFGCALESSPSSEERAGILTFKEILLNLSDKDSTPTPFPSTKLNHDLDPPRRTAQPEPKKDKPKKEK